MKKSHRTSRAVFLFCFCCDARSMQATFADLTNANVCHRPLCKTVPRNPSIFLDTPLSLGGYNRPEHPLKMNHPTMSIFRSINRIAQYHCMINECLSNTFVVQSRSTRFLENFAGNFFAFRMEGQGVLRFLLLLLLLLGTFYFSLLLTFVSMLKCDSNF